LSKIDVKDIAIYLSDFNLDIELEKLKDCDWRTWLNNPTTEKFFKLLNVLKIEYQTRIMNIIIEDEKTKNEIIRYQGMSDCFSDIFDSLDQILVKEEDNKKDEKDS